MHQNSSQKDAYSSTILPQEIRKYHKPNIIPKTNTERKAKQTKAN